MEWVDRPWRRSPGRALLPVLLTTRSPSWPTRSWTVSTPPGPTGSRWSERWGCPRSWCLGAWISSTRGRLTRCLRDTGRGAATITTRSPRSSGSNRMRWQSSEVLSPSASTGRAGQFPSSLRLGASRSQTRRATRCGTRRRMQRSCARSRRACARASCSSAWTQPSTTLPSRTSSQNATSQSPRSMLMPDPQSTRPTSHNLFDLAPPDLQWFLERSDIVLVPIGSLEQHGPHLPLGTDTITALEVSKRAAELADVPYAPPLWAGYSPQHLRDPGTGTGTITLRASTLNDLLYDIARSLIHHGWNKLIFVNGHGSNVKVIDPVLRRIRYETGAMVALYKPYAERYIGFLKDVLENPPAEPPGGHASELETSQVMAHDAGLVHMDRAVDTRAHAPAWLPKGFDKADGAPDIEFGGYQYFNFPMDHAEFTETGVIGNPFRATAKKGDEALNRFARHLVQAIDAFRPLKFEIKNRAYVDRV